MKTSESLIKIAPALLKAQKSMGAAKKDAVNPFFKSKYADLGSVMEACKESLNDSGISVFQPVCGEVVKTRLIHESGEWIESEGTLIVSKSANDPQAQGSAITYARRYDLQSLVFIPAEDDDGNTASPVSSQKPASKVTQSQPLFCKVHETTMGLNRFGKPFHQNANKEFCNGFGFPSESQGA